VDSTEKLINIFNGNLRLHKSKELFSHYLELFNQLAIQNNPNFPVITPIVRDNPITFKDAWFSGFIDAAGSFNACLQPMNSSDNGEQEPVGTKSISFDRIRLRLRFTLCKKNEKVLLDQLVKLFGDRSILVEPMVTFDAVTRYSEKNASSKVHSYKKNFRVLRESTFIFPPQYLHNGIEEFRYYSVFELHEKEGIQLLLTYLSKYPLKSNKAIDLKRFSKLFQRKYDNRDHSTPKAWARLKRLCDGLSGYLYAEEVNILLLVILIFHKKYNIFFYKNFWVKY
jgi:hypothetical protein